MLISFARPLSLLSLSAELRQRILLNVIEHPYVLQSGKLQLVDKEIRLLCRTIAADFEQLEVSWLLGPGADYFIRITDPYALQGLPKLADRWSQLLERSGKKWRPINVEVLYFSPQALKAFDRGAKWPAQPIYKSAFGDKNLVVLPGVKTIRVVLSNYMTGLKHFRGGLVRLSEIMESWTRILHEWCGWARYHEVDIIAKVRSNQHREVVEQCYRTVLRRTGWIYRFDFRIEELEVATLGRRISDLVERGDAGDKFV